MSNLQGHYEGRHLQGFWAATLILLGHPTGPALCVGFCSVNEAPSIGQNPYIDFLVCFVKIGNKLFRKTTAAFLRHG